MKPELLQLLEIAEAACAAAGRTILTYREGEKGVREKVADHSLVTDADLAAHEELLLKLGVTRIPVVSEEDTSHGECPSEGWIVDPLDGTTNFSRGLPLFSVSVALVSKSEVVAGVVYAPCTGEIFAAARGFGLRVNGKILRRAGSAPEPGTFVSNSGTFLSNSGREPTDESGHVRSGGSIKRLAFVNHGYDPKDADEARRIATAVGRGFSLRCLGTSALELAYVTAGKADAFLTLGDKIWDYAAGLIMAQEAGCKITNWKGEARPTIDTPQLLVAHPSAHPIALELLEGSFATGG